jgi:hypothetical protein
MAKKPPTIAAKKLADFAEIIGQRRCIRVSVGPNLEPVILSLAAPLDDRGEESLRKRELLPVDQEGKRIRKFAAFGRRSSLFLVTEEALFAVELAAV